MICSLLTDPSLRIKCLVGEEWCTLDMFSNKKLDELRKQMRKGTVDPADTGLICREHSEHQITELLCTGHCGKIKPLAAFSKNTRAKNKEYVGCLLQVVHLAALFTNHIIDLHRVHQLEHCPGDYAGSLGCAESHLSTG